MTSREDAGGTAGDSKGAPAVDGRATPEPSGVDLARVALRAARERARERGASTRQKKQTRGPGARSGARRDGRDPMPLKSAVQRLLTERGWETPTAVGGVLGRWPEIVGPQVAQHCEPQHFDEGEHTLIVRCDSTAWATQLRWMAPKLVARLNEDLGHGTVRAIRVRGPEAPRRSAGPLRAPGSSGPGDTYG